MQEQKLENLLNLALDATEEERRKSMELDIGYNLVESEWDLIIKYEGDLSEARALGQVVELANGYGIITIKENLVERLAMLPQIIFIEKPKRLFFETLQGKSVSCILPVQRAPLNLTGEGVLTAIIDSGIAYTEELFRKEDGGTRILNLWDQTIPGDPPEGYVIGTEYSQSQINEALRKTSRKDRLEIVASEDISGHGTAVAGVAAGNANDYQGVAIRSELLIVKLGVPRENGFPRTTELMQALDYVVKKAQGYNKPVAINLSFGNTYGAHDGTSLLERYIDELSARWKNVICIGTGNEGSSAGHTAGRVDEEADTVIELAVQEKEVGLNIQIWKAYFDEMDISLITPSGAFLGPINEILGTQRFIAGSTKILLYYGEPKPYTIDQEIFIDFIPTDEYIADGIWKIVLSPRRIVRGDYAMWLPSKNLLNEGTGFLEPIPEGTITIPATAFRTIGVGAYDSNTMTYAAFSGRGAGNRVKPDIAAPGVNILAPTPSGIFKEMSGTSFSTPFVTGSAALLMEWGVVRGNDPYLYGEKIKAYLQRGAKPILGIEEYPNRLVGYGALCLEESFP